jgi:hypothetical protein
VLSNFGVLLQALQPSTQRKVAMGVVRSIRASGTTVSGREEMNAVASFLEPLVAADLPDADVVRGRTHPLFLQLGPSAAYVFIIAMQTQRSW